MNLAEAVERMRPAILDEREPDIDLTPIPWETVPTNSSTLKELHPMVSESEEIASESGEIALGDPEVVANASSPRFRALPSRNPRTPVLAPGHPRPAASRSVPPSQLRKFSALNRLTESARPV
jgi:hypothetical protein